MKFVSNLFYCIYFFLLFLIILIFFLAALDGISMIVECLLQTKSSDKELYQSGRSFLQSFASNDQRAQFVIDCGGGYIL